MRDGQQAPVAVDGNVSTTPPEGFGGFSLDKDELRSKDSRIRFGRLIRGGRTTFACDVWADALPFGKDEFVTLDSFGQLWRWTDSNGTLTRRFIELPSAIRDSRPKHGRKGVAVQSIQNTSCFLGLDERGVNRSWRLHRPQNRVFGDLVKGDALNLNSLCGLKNLQQVPRKVSLVIFR